MRLDADAYSIPPDPLTPEDRAQLAALPRERLSSAALEDRVVRALVAQHLLRPRRGSAVRLSRLAAMIAAALMIFVGGYAAGRSSTVDSRPAAMGARVDSAQLGRLVQRAGSEYVRLLERIPVADSTDPRVTVGREAARATLRAAAKQVARVDPSDAFASVILEELSSSPQLDSRGAQRLWF
jgi:hypothetical protein